MTSELNGYDNKADVPEYRIFTPINLGNFQGYGGAAIKNSRLPMMLMPDYIQEAYSQHYAMYGVSFYEGHFSNPETTDLSLAWDPNAIALLQHEVTIYQGYVLVEASANIARLNFIGIFGTVKNRLLELALELQKNYPDSEENLGQLPSDGVSNIINMTVNGGQQNFASGTRFTQTPTQHVHVSSFEELSDILRGLGVAEVEVEQLKVAVNLDRSDKQQGQLGRHVRRWLGDVSANAAGGVAAAVAVQNLPQIVQAVDHFVKHLG